jgi:hypothetical protein
MLNSLELYTEFLYIMISIECKGIVFFYPRDLSVGKSEDNTQHGLINYIDTKAQCRHKIFFTCKGTLRQVFI